MCVYTRFQSLNRFSAKFIHSSWRNSAYGSAARAEQEDERGLEKPQAAPPQAASRPGFQSFRPNANPSIPQQSQWSNQVGPRGNAPKNQSEWRAPDRPIGGGAVGYPGPSSSSVSTFQRSSQGGGISSPIPPAPGPTTRPTGPLPAGYQPGYQPGFQRPPPGYPPLRPPQNFTGPAQSSYHKNNTSSTPAPFPGQSTSPLGSGQLGYQPGYQRMPLPPNGAPPNGASPNGAPSRPLQNLPGPVPPGNQPYQKNNMPPPFPAPTQSNYSSTHPSYQRQPPPPVDFPSRLPQGNSGHTQQPYQPGYQRQPLPPGGASPRSGQNPTEPSPLGYRSGYLGQPIPPNGASPRLGQNSSGPAPPGYQPRYQGQPIPPNGAFPRLGQNSSGPAPPGYQPGLQGQPIPPNGAPPRLGQKLAGPAPLGSQGNSTSPPFPNITQGSYGSTQSGYQPGYQRQQLPSRPPQNYSGPTQSGNQQPGYQGSGISSNTSQFSSQGHDPFGSRYERAQLPSTSERRQASGYQPQFNPLGTTVSTPGQFHGILDELVEGKSLLRRNDMNRQDTLPQWDRRSTGGTQGNLQGQNGQFVQSGQHGAQQEQMQAEPARETRRAKPEVELDKAGKKKNKDRGKRGFGAAESWILDEDEAATKEAKRLKKLQKKEKPIPLYLPEFISVANLAKTVKQPLGKYLHVFFYTRYIANIKKKQMHLWRNSQN